MSNPPTSAGQNGPNNPNPTDGNIFTPWVSKKYQLWSYYALGALIKIFKYVTLVRTPYSAAECWEYYRIWLVVNILYCLIPVALDLQVFQFSSAKWTAIYGFLTFWVSDISMIFGSPFANPPALRIASLSLKVSFLNPFLTHFRTYAAGEYGTGRFSPADTARLNPSRMSFCISQDGDPVPIPLALQHPDLVGLKFAYSPLDPNVHNPHFSEHRILSTRDLRGIKQRYANHTEVRRHSSDNYVFLEVSKPGTIWIERVIYFPNLDARIASPVEVTVPPCPRARFAISPPATGDLRCEGCDVSASPLIVDIHGVPPLSLKWSKVFNLERTPAVIENIAPNVPGNPLTVGGQFYSGEPKQPRPMRLTIPMSCSDIGDHIYVLDVITDSLGNEVRLHEELVSTHQVAASDVIYPLTVLQRPSVSFNNCSKQNPIFILRGTEKSLLLSTNATSLHGQNWVDVLMKYRPSEIIEGGPSLADLFLWERVFTAPGGENKIEVPTVLAGEYILIRAKDKHCTRELKPNTLCPVLDLPLPGVNSTSWTNITDCYGTKGISVAMSLTGTPPFSVFFTLFRKGYPPKEEIKVFDERQAHFEIEPAQGGDYVLSFNRMSDANYTNVPISTEKINASIQTPMSAEFVGGRFDTGLGAWVLKTCDDKINVMVKLSGYAPWELGLRTTGPSGPELRTIQNIHQSLYTFEVDIPPSVRDYNGSIEIEIVTVEDARKCKIDVDTPRLLVDVRDQKPTASFEGERVADGFESELMDLPIRFTGHPPWRISYRRDGIDPEIMSFNSSSPQDKIAVKVPGHYQIISVDGRDCPGSVVQNMSSFQVNAIPRPLVTLPSTEGALYEPQNNSWTLRSSCQDDASYLSLDLKGEPPFHFAFRITEQPNNGHEVVYDPTFYSTENRHDLQLQTSSTGRVLYELTRIVDAVHLIANRTNLPLLEDQRLMLEQRVYTRPTARFIAEGPLEQYLHGKFLSHGWESSVSLAGLPPYSLQLSIQHLESGQIDTVTVAVNTSSGAWRINVPDYTFRTLGRHLVAIASLSDASGCLQDNSLLSSPPLYVDVYPNPIVMPPERHFCSGDVAKFELQGPPPWTVHYRLNGYHYSEEVASSPLSIIIDRPGYLSLSSISHHETRRPMLIDTSYQIFDPPSAVVTYPTRIHQDNVPDDEHIAVKFIFQGAPPFTFTYQRADPSGERDLGDNNRFERHTVYDLSANHYTLDSSHEGQWEVVELTDRFCRRP